MREYLISTGIVCLIIFTLYTLYNYNIVMMTFIKTSIVMSIFMYLIYTMKIMIFG